MFIPQPNARALSSYPINITPLLLWNLQKCSHCHQHLCMLKGGVIMLHNKAWTVQDTCNEKCCSISYNLDLSLSAFHVLDTLKNKLNGHRFWLNKNIKAGIWQQPGAFLVNKIHHWCGKGMLLQRLWVLHSFVQKNPQTGFVWTNLMHFIWYWKRRGFNELDRWLRLERH